MVPSWCFLAAFQGRTMDLHHRELININFPELVEKTVNLDELIDHLVAKETLSEEIADVIKSQDEPDARAKYFYTLLPRQGVDAFRNLIEACHDTGNDNVAFILKGNRLSNQSPTGGLSPVDSQESDTDYEERYRVKSYPRGNVLIVNIFAYSNVELTRLGSENDVENLTVLFTEMGYKVACEPKGTKEEIENTLRAWTSQASMGDVDCAIIIFMAHGNEGTTPGSVLIQTGDSKCIESEWLIDSLSAVNAPYLVKKPKLVFILTCRGDLGDYGTDVRKLTNFTNGLALESNPFDTSEYKRPSEDIVPRLSDILLVYPCAPGKTSFRDEYNGSWFVQEMCRVFRKKAYRDDVETMLKEMDRNIVNVRSSQTPSIFQVICYTSRGFRRKLYLNPVKSFVNGNK
ncbi:Caspase domain [Nesidiocoris tenuis]|uniref:Caspase domain n=1 Tax=Nesidiocoris tenuis TaxID=355587 RepID=A0ABN7AX73_9HEMI|nr:Caspase domain [Nesidiocoris tenuis]